MRTTNAGISQLNSAMHRRSHSDKVPSKKFVRPTRTSQAILARDKLWESVCIVLFLELKQSKDAQRVAEDTDFLRLSVWYEDVVTWCHSAKLRKEGTLLRKSYAMYPDTKRCKHSYVMSLTETGNEFSCVYGYRSPISS